MRTLIKIYAILFCTFTLFVMYLESSFLDDPLNIIVIFSNILDCMGVVGFSFRLQIFNQIFWRGWFVVTLIVAVVFEDILEYLLVTTFDPFGLFIQFILFGWQLAFFVIIFWRIAKNFRTLAGYFRNLICEKITL